MQHGTGTTRRDAMATFSPSLDDTAGMTVEANDNWSTLQLLVVGLCFVVNMIDGMDVLILSYIAPTLQADLGLGADQIGVLFSAGLVGMAVGGLLIAPLADIYGRRKLILASFITSTAAMILSGFVDSLCPTTRCAKSKTGMPLLVGGAQKMVVHVEKILGWETV
jgi:MFS family permease